MYSKIIEIELLFEKLVKVLKENKKLQIKIKSFT